MPVKFNHTIIPAKDGGESARFFRELLDLPEAPSWGPFTNILLDDGVLLQFAELPGVDEIQLRHYAFLLDDDLFDRAHARLRAAGVEHWADPGMTAPARPTPSTAAAASTFSTPRATPSS
ncbi:hypothetical protein GCM10010171_32000 [Actinokineospora fastidiosa]|uniref:VOC domain-containing protein n=1 Tax=Actinokineospora fastidiosa TaxID=1816 RepID=A0A918GGP3_9PSEU|nr:hypothetical protein GCM10010171_32000 [Actinokineospora fastidiosa]